MKQTLTEEQIASLCMYMRVIDLMKSNPDVCENNPAMKEQLEKICQTVDGILALLTDEQKDELLETHKIQLENLNKNLSK